VADPGSVIRGGGHGEGRKRRCSIFLQKLHKDTQFLVNNEAKFKKLEAAVTAAVLPLQVQYVARIW